MTSAERRSIDNGIWMCRTHAKLIDSDEAKYTVEQLHDWKREAEAEAERRLRTGTRDQAREASRARQIFISYRHVEPDHTRQALEISEVVFGRVHPTVALRANNIGLILQAQGNLDGALVHARRALEIDEAVYGNDHPDVARDANNIGLILKDQSDLDGAREQIARALSIFERVYGPDHPQTVIARNNLSRI